MDKYTVFGGRGFIGSVISGELKRKGHDVYIPERDDNTIFEIDLGTVIYCAGQGDCNNAPFGVFDANCTLLAKVLKSCKFQKLLYLSSTRLYMNNNSSLENDDVLISYDDNRRLFNLTKLVSEELCLKSGRNIVIIRPSNVYGVALNSPLFLPAITRNAILNKKVDMYISPDYEKDYVSVDDVANACIQIAKNKEITGKIINIASGYNVSAKEIANELEKNTGCDIVWHKMDFPNEKFPVTDITLIKSLMPNYKPKNVLNDIKLMIKDFSEKLDID